MTAADKLRMEMVQNSALNKDEFISKICKQIKAAGRACFICDRHIHKTDIQGCGNTICMADEQAAIDMARSEGFRVSYDYNSYGVRYIVFSL